MGEYAWLATGKAQQDKGASNSLRTTPYCRETEAALPGRAR